MDWKQLKCYIETFHKSMEAQDLVEYALIAVLIALGCIIGMGTLATSINAEFSKIASKLT